MAALQHIKDADADTTTLKLLTNDGTGMQTALTIDSSGNVGVGTDSPISELSVHGKISITNETDTPDAPTGDGGYIYTKSDGKLYWRSADLAETDLTGTGTVNASTGTFGNLTLENSSITDSSGTISFGDENLTTTGTLTIGTLTLEDGSITDSSGTISVGDNFFHAKNLKTKGLNNNTWTQIGSDIDGEAAGDQSGYSVSMNANGTIVAIGARYNDSRATNSGQVKIYKWNGNSWTQLGGDINGEAADDQSGYSVSMNANGTIVAIGAPFNDGNGNNSGHVKVYQYNGSSWTQLGSDIDGENPDDESGTYVSLSANGTIIAIGAIKNEEVGTNRGHVKIYEYSGGTWTQLGSDIDGVGDFDNFGNAVSLSANGKKVAIGARNHETSDIGHVRVFQYDGSTWSQLGSDIDGESSGDKSGYSVSLSSNGTIVAIGAHLNDDNGSNSGHVKVYQYRGNSWTQLGSDIDGESSGDQSGYSVSLSSDGSIVAIGANNNDAADENNSNRGHVKVYQYNGISWEQIGSDIDGEALGDQSGHSVSLSSDGTIVAIGAIGNDSNSGHVRVYGLGEYISSLGCGTLTLSNGSITDSSGAISFGTDEIDLTTTGLVDINGATINLTTTENVSSALYLNTLNGGALWLNSSSNIFVDATNNIDLRQRTLIDVSNKQYSPNADGLILHIDNLTMTDNSTAASGTASEDFKFVMVDVPTLNSSNSSVTTTNASTFYIQGSPVETGNMTITNPYALYVNSGDSYFGGNVGIGTSNPGTQLQLEGSSPYLTLKNDTPENTDGGCESKIIFEDHDDTALAQIQASHDGTSDDTKGDLIFSTHDGSNLTEQLRIDSDGNIQIGGNLTNTNNVMSFNDNVIVTRNDIHAKNIKTSHLNNNTWVQLGSDIDGEATGDKSSYSIDMSANGKIIVIGAPENAGGGTERGHVRIYEFNETTLTWSQKGSDINGEANGDHSGFNISLSGNGNTVCIGARFNDESGNNAGHARIYRWNGSAWVQIGSDIDADAAEDRFGYSNGLSFDGNTVVIGADFHDDYNGQAKIFDYNGSAWVKRGSDIDGDSDEKLGLNVRISSNGNIVALGALGNDDNGTDAGVVKIYYWNGSSWIQRGSDIQGVAAGDETGHGLSLSADGNIVALGDHIHDSNRGHVRIFKWDGSSWTQLGSDIQGDAVGDEMGHSVRLSYDGTKIVVGAQRDNGSGTNNGQLKVFQYDGITWNQIGSDINGVDQTLQSGDGELFGHEVTMSADGNIVAGGALFHDSNRGTVRVYRLGEYINDLSVGGNISYSNTNNATLSVSAVSGTDTAGKNLTISAGQGTGTGAGGKIVFQTADGAGSSDSSVNSLVTAMTIANDSNVGIGIDAPIKKLHLKYDESPTGNPFDECLFVNNVNSTTDSKSIILFGQDESTGNRAEIFFNYVGNNHVSNNISFGFYNVPDVVKIYQSYLYDAGVGNLVYYLNNADGSIGSSQTFGNIVMVANNAIASPFFVAYSDSRIKKEIVEINDDECLSKVRLLKPCKYKYIDEISKGSDVVYGFIAQEVREVLPYAVTEKAIPEAIPNIYKGGVFTDGTIVLPEAHGLTENGNIKLKIKINAIDIVCPYTIVNETTLNIDTTNLSADNLPSNDPMYDEDGNELPYNIFVYGTVVDDFHVIRKDAIWTTGISALQEVDRQLQAEKAKTATLESQVADLLARVTALENP